MADTLRIPPPTPEELETEVREAELFAAGLEAGRANTCQALLETLKEWHPEVMR